MWKLYLNSESLPLLYSRDKRSSRYKSTICQNKMNRNLMRLLYLKKPSWRCRESEHLVPRSPSRDVDLKLRKITFRHGVLLSKKQSTYNFLKLIWLFSLFITFVIYFHLVKAISSSKRQTKMKTLALCILKYKSLQ